MRAISVFSPLSLFLMAALALNAVFLAHAWDLRAKWMNVPPVPSEQAAAFGGLGDRELAYRSIALMLQNLGDTGGRSVPLAHYDYKRLAQWFFLTKTLSPHSDFIPYLAAFYFGAVNDGDKARYLVDYLYNVGKEPGRNNWRWLAQAVYLARFQVQDLALAYKLASELAALPVPNLPIWTKQMPAFILNEQGKKDAAYEILLNILRSQAEDLPPQEVNATRDYICRRLLDAQEAQKDPLCRDLP